MENQVDKNDLELFSRTVAKKNGVMTVIMSSILEKIELSTIRRAIIISLWSSYSWWARWSYILNQTRDYVVDQSHNLEFGTFLIHQVILVMSKLFQIHNPQFAVFSLVRIHGSAVHSRRNTDSGRAVIQGREGRNQAVQNAHAQTSFDSNVVRLDF